MIQPQELVVVKVFPTLRARVAQVLLQDYALKQVEVAKLLGITQAAVSHYNTKTRGVDAEVMRLFPEIEGHALEIAWRIRNGMSRMEQIARFNEICAFLTRTERFCKYHKRVASLDPKCDVCFPGTGMPLK